ncbi:Phage holin family Hol44, holin superfamily V [Oceanobacillus limi]|uniref:Phage holin family Hol44, holin superfamily V n=1 Tax=Oceanobacillus limi TaxID=930131 RepID=A0A1I0E700_9BACI|nr:phage holin family protein [Oceanobacillus limi]SET40205.1 Phage holin family Hol44, holin superfamily V [Oceanobacillus limi]
MELFQLMQPYIFDEAFILIPVLLIFGFFLKRTPYITNWVIPWILLILGVILSFLILGFTITAFIQGVLVVGASVLLNQLYKQTLRKK